MPNGWQAITWTNYDPLHQYLNQWNTIHMWIIIIGRSHKWACARDLYLTFHNRSGIGRASAGLLPKHSQISKSLRWRHNELDGVSDHQPHDCLLNRLFGRRSKKTSKLRVNGLCAENSPGTGEFPTQKASNAENVSIWWRHHVIWV